VGRALGELEHVSGHPRACQEAHDRVAGLLTLATNAIVTWTTEYHGLAVAALRRGGRGIDDAVLAHIWPTHHENFHF